MTQRSRDYMNRRKAIAAMQHPGDLKSFLIAEHDSSRNLIVKKDIRKMIDAMEPQADGALQQ